MKLRKIILLTAVCLQSLSLAAAPRIVRPGVKSATTFAIFIDSRSYAAATAEVDAYRAAVERDGLGTYLLVDEWPNPECVRSEIIRLEQAQPPLEGMVFIGDIPVAMIRDAQHLTSAFKSNQNRDWKDSSVPSDRYYDDPKLQFEFLRRDADEPLYFYYSLTPESPQHIASPLYSARIKPPKREGVDSDELLRAYLRKVVKAHAERNELDNLFVFRGHGYNSEAPEAWAGEQIALREQLPALFRTGGTVRFYDFESRWPMKPYLLEKMGRKGVDVALCHHHGSPDTQYLNGYQNGSGMSISIENIQRFLRSKIDGSKDPEKRTAEMAAYYGVPEAWCRLSDSLHAADSIYNRMMDIHIEDLHARPMNPRMVMFDACYNGSFHLDDCIASSYIFGPGDCIIAQGNTVNALQDKWPDRYLGLLDCGVRIGQWGRHVHYLETHLIGDPTYRFVNRALPGTDLNAALTTKAADNKYWLRMADAAMPADVQAIALRKLADNGCSKLADLCEQRAAESSYGPVRLEALTLMSNSRSPRFKAMLVQAAGDSYELVRRMVSLWIGDCGDDELVPAAVGMLLDDELSLRVTYHANSNLTFMNADAVSAELRRQSAAKPELYRNDELLHKRLKSIAAKQAGHAETFGFIRNPQNKFSRRLSEITYFRLYRHHSCVPDLIALAEDPVLEEPLRVAAVEALGWFGRSFQRPLIETMCEKLNDGGQPAAIRAGALRTSRRLAAY